jgi:hypothetical protein
MKEGWAWRSDRGGVGMDRIWRRGAHGERMEEGWAWKADGRGMGMESRWR